MELLEAGIKCVNARSSSLAGISGGFVSCMSSRTITTGALCNGGSLAFANGGAGVLVRSRVLRGVGKGRRARTWPVAGTAVIELDKLEVAVAAAALELGPLATSASSSAIGWSELVVAVEAAAALELGPLTEATSASSGLAELDVAVVAAAALELGRLAEATAASSAAIGWSTTSILSIK